MSIFIREDKGNAILIQGGNGAPSHLSPRGTLFVDKDQGVLYINKNNLSDWSYIFDSTSIITGGTASGTSILITGGTFNSTNGTLILTNSTGGTVTVTGFTSTNAFTGGTVTGSTIFTNGLITNTISATTYQNLPIDIFVTGGTYSNGTAVFTNNSGGTFNISGITDTTITGGTFNQNTRVLNLNNNTGGTINISGITDTTITGGSYTATHILLENNTGGTTTLLNSDFINWTDYSTGSTIVGFASFTSRNIQYMVLGKLMFVQFDLRTLSPNGTGTTTSFTIPFNSSSWTGEQRGIAHGVNSTTQASLLWKIAAGSNIIEFAPNANDTNFSGWNNSTARRIEGQFFINIQ